MVRSTHHPQTLVKFSRIGETDGMENGAWDAPYLVRFYDLDPLILTPAQTYAYRRQFKTQGQTRTYLFHRNLIYAPIVGDRLGKGEEQFKWESNMVERLLNSNAVTKRSV